MFKHIIGISLKSLQGGGIIRFDQNNLSFKSFLDSKITVEGYNNVYLPKVHINRWLKDYPDDDDYEKHLAGCLANNLNIRTAEDYEIKPMILRQEMAKIVKRIDRRKQEIYHISYICKRVEKLLNKNINI